MNRVNGVLGEIQDRVNQTQRKIGELKAELNAQEYVLDNLFGIRDFIEEDIEEHEEIHKQGSANRFKTENIEEHSQTKRV